MNSIAGMIQRQVTDARSAIAPTYVDASDLSTQARDALISCGTNRQGAVCAPLTNREALKELQSMGFLGEAWGLTRRGTIKRQILVDDQMDSLFS